MILMLFILGYQKLWSEFLNCIINPNLGNRVKVLKVWLNAKYYPPINPTERVTRVLVTTISSYIKDSQHREWNKHILETAQVIRSARHDSTQMSPNQLVFGRHVPIYGDLYNSVDLDKPLKIDNI
ncbi:hypothetical protein ILUMI_19638 [Ignelater luminosus]|uniref:Uncharacterized protein n=1 Tax=Ignelater luminosus TaxID=2038154 RepID=A0A8K0CIX1_IGNLU|nr:hypothetical protein ILUMI_19638 [Ignelater luminosus]